MGSEFDRLQEKVDDRGKLTAFVEKRVAQEAYGPLKIAVEIIGLLNTASMEPEDRKRGLRKDVAQLSNPFDSDQFVKQLKRWTEEFAHMTGASSVAAFQVYELLEYDITHEKYIEARKKVTDLSLYFMDQTMRYLKREYPW